VLWWPAHLAAQCKRPAQCSPYWAGLPLLAASMRPITSMAARASRDLTLRRAIDAVVYETRVEISEAASKLTDERGEPEETKA
jgi:hypothetical protein